MIRALYALAIAVAAYCGTVVAGWLSKLLH